MTDERRAAFRVSVKRTSGLHTTVCLANQTWEAKAGNVSTEGMFVRLEPEAPVSLERGTPVIVEITFGGDVSTFHGEIRSRRAGGYGIFFPRRCEDGFINPLDRLENIWAQLQRDDLSKRLFVGSELRDRLKEEG
ncbi:MAG: hypothetical protein HKN84_04150 [Gammaproteobacteria bacterium]|nr:hypothetical protein [Gammaproteobacteria bacterium]